MILSQWRGPTLNFGDELNGLLWPKLLPGFFDREPGTRFLGIGSILGGRHDNAVVKLVAGSGYGGYEKPAVLDETWIIHWVRGRRTARLLGLPPSLGLGDPASLISLIGAVPARMDRDVGFMPHFESAMRGAWHEAAAATGVTLIDPRGDPLPIVAAIARCRLLLSEALHGVIVADALRVPWIAIEPLAPIHRPKWADWAETLDLDIAFRRLRPSSAFERAYLTRLSRAHLGRRVLNRMEVPLRGIGRNSYIEQATVALHAAAAAEPRLSEAPLLHRRQSQMMDAIDALRRAPMRGWRRAGCADDQTSPPPLHECSDSAYQNTPSRLPA